MDNSLRLAYPPNSTGILGVMSTRAAPARKTPSCADELPVAANNPAAHSHASNLPGQWDPTAGRNAAAGLDPRKLSSVVRPF